MSSELTIDDLHLIATELLPAKNKWQAIGTALDLKAHDIEGINGTDSQQALIKMLSTVLERTPLTWEQLIDVLREPLVSQYGLANELANIYGEFSKNAPCQLALCYVRIKHCAIMGISFNSSFEMAN